MFEDNNTLKVPNQTKDVSAHTCSEPQSPELQSEVSFPAEVIPVIIHHSEMEQPTQQQIPPTSPKLGDEYRVVSLQDLRREKKLETERETLAQRAKELSTVSHELRAAVHGILGACELLNEHIKKLKESADKEALQQIHNIFSASSTQLTDVTNAYLSGQRMPKNFNIKIIMEETYTILLGMQQKSNPSIKVLLDIQSLENNEAHGDPLAIRQIILNLGGNAIKFTKEGEVRIGLGSERQDKQSIYYKLWIQDTGPGLQKEQIKEIWTPRSNVHSPNHTKIKGTGLGLSITQDIVTQLGGSIDTQSIIGKGTTFTISFSLPRAKLEENYTEHKKTNAVECLEQGSTALDTTMPSQSPLLPPNLSVLKRKILAVDDTYINLQILARHFRNHPNYTLITVNSGEEAIEYLKNNDCDTILLDQQMPGLSGVQTAITIREMGKNVPIIFTTGDTDPAWQKSLVEYQHMSVLPKPCSKKDIFDAIKQAISQSENAPEVNTTNKELRLLTAFDASKNLSAPLTESVQKDQSEPPNNEQQKGQIVKTLTKND